MSDMWNSSDFNPVAHASDCHTDYIDAIDCSHTNVEMLSPATPQKIEDLLVSMRSDLLRIITRWEQSGQGEGGRDQEENEEEGSDNDIQSVVGDDILTRAHQARQEENIRGGVGGLLSGRPARALQSRAAFLNGKPSYLLYFWEVADTHQLLQSTLQRLNSNTGASDASFAPSTSSTSSVSRGRNHRQVLSSVERQSIVLLAQSIRDLTECQRQLAFDQAEERRQERRQKQERDERRHQEETQERQLERCFRRKAELSDLARKYRKLNAELDPNNANSQRLSDFYVAETNEIVRELQELNTATNSGTTTS